MVWLIINSCLLELSLNTHTQKALSCIDSNNGVSSTKFIYIPSIFEHTQKASIWQPHIDSISNLWAVLENNFIIQTKYMLSFLI